MRFPVLIFGMTALAACGGPSVPDSGAPATGPAFGTYQDYTTYRNERDATLNGTASPSQTTAPASGVGAGTGTTASTATPPGTTTTATAIRLFYQLLLLRAILFQQSSNGL